ncbi:MAG: c-type cytochrome domain-containing protein, partial [Verrucomicrobiia bacterium]
MLSSKIRKVIAVYFAIFNYQVLFSAKEVDFTKQVRPILSEYCFHCHGPDKGTREAKLRLDLSAGALKDLGG